MSDNKERRAARRAVWKEIVGGDILATDFIRRQTRLIVLVVVLVFMRVLLHMVEV